MKSQKFSQLAKERQKLRREKKEKRRQKAAAATTARLAKKARAEKKPEPDPEETAQQQQPLNDEYDLLDFAPPDFNLFGDDDDYRSIFESLQVDQQDYDDQQPTASGAVQQMEFEYGTPQQRPTMHRPEPTVSPLVVNIMRNLDLYPPATSQIARRPNILPMRLANTDPLILRYRTIIEQLDQALIIANTRANEAEEKFQQIEAKLKDAEKRLGLKNPRRRRRRSVDELQISQQFHRACEVAHLLTDGNKGAEQWEKGVENRGDDGCADEKAAATAPSPSKKSSSATTTTRHGKCRQRMQQAEQELCELRRQLAEQKLWQQMAMQQLELDQDRIAELENELRISNAQNELLRRRLLHGEDGDSPSSSNARLIAPPNSKPTTLTSRQQQQGLENQNPTNQFVAALEEAEEERKDVALLNNNTIMATTSSSTLSNVEDSSINNRNGGIYANKRNAKSKEPGARRRGYNLFASELRKKLLEEYPCISSSEMYKILSTEWKRLHFELKREYEERAAQIIADERERAKAAAQIELHKEQQHQVQAVPVQQQAAEQHSHHEHPPSASSAGTSPTVVAEFIKEEAMDDA